MIRWELRKFNELNLNEFHDLIALRIAVFVIEQDCPYQDLDGLDKVSHHLIALENDKLIATTRIVPPGTNYPQASIGRVVVDPSKRGTGLGHKLIAKSIVQTQLIHGKNPIKISAQLYLQKYYEAHGFVKVTDVYLEDNIEHIGMMFIP